MDDIDKITQLRQYHSEWIKKFTLAENGEERAILIRELNLRREHPLCEEDQSK